MNQRIFTNLIKPIIHHDVIMADFVIYQVTVDNLQDDYREKVSSIKQQLSPIALIKASDRNQPKTFFALTAQPLTHHSFKDFTVARIITIDGMPLLDWVRLVFRTLTLNKYQATIPDQPAPVVCESGVYYCFHHELHHNHLISRAHEVDAQYLTGDKSQVVLTVRSVCFTPRQYFANRHDYQQKITKLQSFELANFGEVTHIVKRQKPKVKQQELQAICNNSTDHIMRAPNKAKGKSKRLTNPNIVLNPKNPLQFFASKSGCLAQFMLDVKLYLAKYIQLEFQEISKDYQASLPNHKSFDRYFTAMIEMLRKHPIYLLTHENVSTMFANDVQNHLQQTWQINATPIQKINDNAPNTAIYLLLHHDQQHYIDHNLDDPYRTWHQQVIRQKSIAQSLTVEEIYPENRLNSNGLEKCLCELFIKLENQQQALLIEAKPAHHWQLIKPTLLDDERKYVNRFDGVDYHPKSNRLHHWTLDNQMDNDPKDSQRFDDLSFIYLQLLNAINGKIDAKTDAKPHTDDHVLIQKIDENTHKYYLIRESNLLPTADVLDIWQVMTDITNARQHGFVKQWAVDYLKQIPQIPAKLQAQLLQICQYPAPILPIDVFDKTGIAYQGAGRAFLDWVFKNYHHRYNASLRHQDSSTVKAVCGFYYNHQHKVYTAGLYDSPKGTITHFNRMRKVACLQGNPCQPMPYDDIPAELFSLIENHTHIRHRQSTVLPIFAKHLREYQHIQQLITTTE